MKTTLETQWRALHKRGMPAADAAAAMGVPRAKAYAVARELGIAWQAVPRGRKRGPQWSLRPQEEPPQAEPPDRHEYKQARRARGTQGAVAAALGVAVSTIARREAGDVPLTREAMLALLSLPTVHARS